MVYLISIFSIKLGMFVNCHLSQPVNSKMKVAALVLALVAFVASAPQPRKDFHDHFADFVTIISEEVGSEIEHVFEHYLEFEEFQAAVEYIKTANFKELILEMESLPQFQAVSILISTIKNTYITYIYNIT